MILIGIIALLINIYLIICFVNMCSDIREIRNYLINKNTSDTTKTQTNTEYLPEQTEYKDKEIRTEGISEQTKQQDNKSSKSWLWVIVVWIIVPILIFLIYWLR